jgi:predicted AlkP superfamily pyrophosphatase or phosphodiesterase
MHVPEYDGGSLVNLMASLVSARGGDVSLYPPLSILDDSLLCKVRNLVLIVIDGLGYDYLINRVGHTTLQKHLRGRITSVFPSTTASAITTFLTGTAPHQHGITGWFTYFGELGRIITVLPFKYRETDTPVSATGIQAAELFNHVSVFDRIDTESWVVVPEHIAYSEFNVSHCGAATIKPYRSLTQFFKTITAVVHQHDQPKYVYAYWPKLDRIAHEHGIGSRAANAHYAQLDVAFDRFLTQVAGDDSLIIVTADHGMIDSGPQRQIECEDHPELTDSLLRPLCGERRAAYCYVQPGKRSRFESYVQDTLKDCASLYKSEDLLQQGIFGLGQPHPALRQRIGDYTIIMKDNYTIKDWLPGEHRYVHIGTHGGVSPQEMYVPIIVVEP